VTNRPLVVRPGPKRLAAALALAGFSASKELPAVTDACGVHWPHPSELQIALALCGGESSGSASAYHTNTDGSTDYGLLEINDKAHPSYFRQASGPVGWLWTDWLNNAQAAYGVYVAAGRQFTPWMAYTGGGFKAERYQGRSWLDWASYGIGQMLPAVAALTKQGKTETSALATVASVDDDALTYWT
jgi:hypothetical protein